MVAETEAFEKAFAIVRGVIREIIFSSDVVPTDRFSNNASLESHYTNDVREIPGMKRNSVTFLIIIQFFLFVIFKFIRELSRSLESSVLTTTEGKIVLIFVIFPHSRSILKPFRRIFFCIIAEI